MVQPERRFHVSRLVALALVLTGPAGTALEAQIYTRTNANGVVEATNVPDEPGFRLTYPGKGTLIHSRGFRRAYSGEFDRHIADAAATYGVSADLVRAVIQIESEFDQMAVSSKGAQGLMQLMPFTARRFGVADAFDPRQNIFGGVQYLRVLLDLFQGDVALALAGYNAGENAVLRYRGIPPYRETRQYVQKIQGLLSSAGPLYLAARSTPERPAPRTAGSATGGAAPVIAFAPSAAPRATRLAQRAARLVPARPRVYYKWLDARGLLHVAQAPPEDGVAYTTIRALD
jgi:hypothetical protein